MMKQSRLLMGALVVLPLLAAGCKKKDDAAKEGSAKGTGTGSASASGSGSASASGSGTAAASGSGTASASGSGTASGTAAAPDPAAEPVAPWAADAEPAPATSKVTGKRDGTDEGTFDRALYFKSTDKWDTTKYTVMISTACEKFACAHVDWLRGGVYTNDEKLAADCPSAKVMTVTFNVEGDPKPGPIGVDISINGFTSGGELSGQEWAEGSSFSAVSDKEIKGTIALKDGESEAKGDFAAKVCGTVVQAKDPE